ncbi:MAG: DotU family type IV/VI secretion system protein [Alphaproteobacteria bacterium]|jgi:type VI secretion system protein ImpK|nr:DotU family type IV/VI secretion system protein [Alphaproteobacteria bacterium]
MPPAERRAEPTAPAVNPPARRGRAGGGGGRRQATESFDFTDRFAAFYRDVLVAKAMAAEPLAEVSQAYRHSRYNVIFSHLIAALEERMGEISEFGGEYARRLYARFLFILVAFADDVLLSIPWWGREQWVSAPLEAHIFGTRVAGDTFFDDIDGDLAGYGIGRAELARVYLAALALGFQGKYRGRDAAPLMDDYRRRLYGIAYGVAAERATAGDQLVGQALDHTRRGGVPRRLPSLKPWILACLGVLLLYMAIGHAIWIYEVGDLPDRVQALRLRLN